MIPRPHKTLAVDGRRYALKEGVIDGDAERRDSEVRDADM